MSNCGGRVLAFFVVAGLAGCSALTSFDGLTGGAGDSDGGATSDDASPEAAMSADAVSEAASDAPADVASDAPSGPCDPKKPFGPPVNLPNNINTSQDETGARISPDGLTLYFSRGTGSLRTLISASRAQLTDEFASPTNLIISGVTTAENPSITATGLTLYFQSPLPAAGADDVWVATRTSTVVPFSGAAAVPNVNAPGASVADGEALISADGSTLYFDSTRSGQYDIWYTTLGVAGAFATPALRGVGEAASNTGHPVLTADGLTLYFGSDRSPGAGAQDIYVAHRSTMSDDFGAAANVVELNSASDDWPTSVSTDGCTLYFSSARVGTAAHGLRDIWVTKRPK